ncbi:LAMI_0H06392g1_1 [Lachancea mirantina]|uniref:LAMI_0H06392g1_1 n=1 Tax=Lachancea mirantina TaxID=1230905 RepID=A0A1G4KF72_9SACH|nr:LAMI_0H06392g1_1 [Lachancea mirantina]
MVNLGWDYGPRSSDLIHLKEMRGNPGDVEVEIKRKIAQAREETHQLQIVIERTKKKVQDANLAQMSLNVASIGKEDINLKSQLVLGGHNNKISDFRWTSDSQHILSASQDGFMILWDAFSGFKKNAIPLDSQWVLTCAISDSGILAASAGLTNNCTIYRLSEENRVQQQIVSIFKGHTCYISCVEFLGNSNVLTASGDMTCALWDIPKTKKVMEFADHLGDVLTMAIPPKNGADANANIFASGGSDGYVYIWDTRMVSPVQAFYACDSDISTLRFLNGGETIVAGADDGVARMFDMRCDCEIATYSLAQNSQHLSGLKPVKFHPRSPSSYVTNIPVSPATQSVGSSFFDNQGIVSLDFSGSRRLMYVCYTDYGCVIWDTLKAEIVGRLDGHTSRTSGVRTSPDGMAVCTGSWDCTLRVRSPMSL